MAGVIGRLTGAKSFRIIMGPKLGVDVSVLQVGRGRVMILSCDPVSFIPSIGPRASARMSVYEIASDVATCGISPKYAMIDLNLPPHISDSSLTQYWESFHKTCVELGLSIVGGHTGRFEGCDYSVVGGATLWTFCGSKDYVTSRMAKNGDDIILTKSAAYGATSVLTRAFPHTAKKVLGPHLFSKAWSSFSQSNTVKDSVKAASVGIHGRGVTAMHDATEGGVVAALLEMAEASDLGGTVVLDDIPISEETRTLCKFFRINPLISLGEGSLVIASRPQRTSRIIRKLGSHGVEGTVIGKLSSRFRGVQGVTESGREWLKYPSNDPYWKAYWNALRKGWS
jgi:hydrogenase expression/formation protein HypE